MWLNAAPGCSRSQASAKCCIEGSCRGFTCSWAGHLGRTPFLHLPWLAVASQCILFSFHLSAQLLAAAEAEGGLDEEIGVAVEFEDEDEEDEEEEMREVVVSLCARRSCFL